MAPVDHSVSNTDERTALIHREIFQLIALIVIAIAAFLVTRAVASSNREMTVRDAAEWYRRGQDALDAGRVDEAIDSLRRATVRNRNDKRYVLALARALAARRADEAARNILLPLRESAPEDAEINLALARLAAARQDVDEARRFYHTAVYALWPVEHASARRHVRLELVRFLLGRNEAGRALPELLALSADMPDDLPLRLDVGQLFARAGDSAHALDQFQRALRQTPDAPTALAGAGQAAFRLGNYALARTYLHRLPADAGDVRATREIVDLVVTRDPLAARIGSAERRRRLAANVAYARQRLDACVANGPVDENAAALQRDARAFAAVLAKSRSLEQDTVEAGVDLVGRLERASIRQCGPPTAVDQALALIGRSEGADVR